MSAIANGVHGCSQPECSERHLCARAALDKAGVGEEAREFVTREHGDGCAYFLNRSVGISAGWYPKEQRDR